MTAKSGAQSVATEPEFGKLRSLFWPIHSYELKKMVPMLFLFFCISFIYTILRDTKDALIMTAPGSGAEAIPFLKGWCVVPSAILVMLLYAKLSNILDKEKLFYATILPYIIFFALFGFVLYPAREYLHPTTSADYLLSLLPEIGATKGIVAIYRNWTFGVFYILAEMWGSMCLSMLFWGFANDITKTSEAKRFYGLLGVGANVALLFSGQAIVWASSGGESRPYSESLQTLMLMVVAAGLCTVGVYYYMNRNVLTDPRFYDPTQIKKKKAKNKLSMGESAKYLMRSKYLGLVTIIVVAYGTAINLVEVVWKSQLKEQYTNTNDYSAFMGHFSSVTGVVTMFMLIFVSHNVIRRWGWTMAAIITPVVLLITGICFLNFIVFRDYLMGFVATLGTTPLMMAVLFGAAQNIMSKSSKYSLFDPTKEMAYIPLDEESKVKGKAAIDVVGARLGKSAGSWIQQAMLFVVPSAVAMAPYIGGIFLLIAIAWIFAVKALGKRYNEIVAKQEELATSSAPVMDAALATSKATT